MTLKTLVAAAILAVASSSGVTASTLDFTFSFDEGANRLTGTIFGLTDNSTSAASLVSVTSSPGGAFDITPQIFVNEFVVTDGELTDAFFSSGSTSSDAFVGANFQISGGFGSFSAIEAITGSELSAQGLISFTPVAPIPPPAAGLLLLSGIAGFAGWMRRKKRFA